MRAGSSSAIVGRGQLMTSLDSETQRVTLLIWLMRGDGYGGISICGFVLSHRGQGVSACGYSVPVDIPSQALLIGRGGTILQTKHAGG